MKVLRDTEAEIERQPLAEVAGQLSCEFLAGSGGGGVLEEKRRAAS
jgi:hypothetical protein